MTAHDHNDDVATSVTCHSYTHARKYPLVIGKIGGFALPTPLSPSQIGMLLGSFFLLLATRRWWGMFTPGLFDVLVLVLVPGGLTWAVRHLRMEGRSPIKMLIGLVTLATSPRHGTVRGRQVWKPERPRRMVEPIYIVGDPTADTDGDAVAPPHKPSPRPAQVSEILPTSPWACLNEEAAA